jgi:hypothetical protein
MCSGSSGLSLGVFRGGSGWCDRGSRLPWGIEGALFLECFWNGCVDGERELGFVGCIYIRNVWRLRMKVKNPRPSIDVWLRNGYEIDTRSRVRLL